MNSDSSVSEVPSHQDHSPASFNTENGSDSGQPIPHGMGQSKSSRRRRRKRKGKGPEGVAINGSAQSTGQTADSGVDSSDSAPQANENEHSPRQHTSQSPAGQQQNGSSSGTKRWKKKFRDRDRQRPSDNSNPGNQASGGQANAGQASNGHSNGSGRERNQDTHQFGNNAFKQRKGGGGKQQRSSRSGFVGPMDHSYRAVNGNFIEAPPSTIDTHGNYQGRSSGGGRGGYQSDAQPIDYSQGRAIPIPENTQTRIFFFIEDLFFVAKIQETARKLGVKIEFVKNDKEAIAKMTDVEEADRPALIVFDLNNAGAKPMTLIPKLKTKFKRSTSIVGFLSHLQGELKAKAMEAGCDSVMPRAAFSQNLPNLLRRYGILEEEELNFNQ